MGSLGRRRREVLPRKRLSLIALTGFADANIREHCGHGGLDAFLVKPGEIGKLAQPRVSADHFRRSSKRSVSIRSIAPTLGGDRTSSCAAMLLDIHARKAAVDVSELRHTPKPPGEHRHLWGTLMHIVVVGSRDCVRQHTRRESSSKPALQYRQRFRRPLYTQ